MLHREDDNDKFDVDLYESSFGYEPPDPLQKLLADYRKKNPTILPTDNCLEIRTANEWLVEAEVEPPATQLFGDFWKQGELSIMFADTGTGKSILAVQIAETLARGRAETGDERHETLETNSLVSILLSPVSAQRVLYLDFELSSAQFTERYSGGIRNGRLTDPYHFSPNLLRSEIKWDGDLPKAFKTLAAFMSHSLVKRIDETEAKVLIVDNISYLNTANTNANSALTLMKALKYIKSDSGISILVLAHTPKRPITKALTVNDLAGSKMLANFADNMFAIGTSIRAKDLRYIKHIKQRNSPAIHDASNVIVCRLEKMPGPCSPPYEGGVADASSDGVVLSGASKPFLGFSFVEFDDESHHTTRPYDTTNADRAKLIAAAKELSQKGHTQRDIAEMLNIGLTTVNRYLADDTNAEARTQ